MENFITSSESTMVAAEAPASKQEMSLEKSSPASSYPDINLQDYVGYCGDGRASVYVGTYGKYNDGNLFGAWIDLEACQDEEEVWQVCRMLHKDEADPEFMFQDYEGFPSGLYCECGIEGVFAFIEAKRESDNEEAFMAYYERFDTMDNFEDRFMGEWDSEEDFAWHIYEETIEPELPEIAKTYFDLEAFTRDLFFDYEFCDGFVFANY